jgi:hypothetical protein
MNIKITEEQLKKIVNIDEYGIPDEYEELEPKKVIIHTRDGKIDLGKIQFSLAKKLKQVFHSIDFVHNSGVFVEIK